MLRGDSKKMKKKVWNFPWIVLILFVNVIFAVIILISCSKLGIIIIIYFQFYNITAIAALPKIAHGVLRNVVNLVDIIRLILIIFWVSSPSKSSYCETGKQQDSQARSWSS